jgi:hypothetical protein
MKKRPSMSEGREAEDDDALEKNSHWLSGTSGRFAQGPARNTARNFDQRLKAASIHRRYWLPGRAGRR